MTDEELIRFSLHGIKIAPWQTEARRADRRSYTLCAMIKRAQTKRRRAA